MAKDTGEWSIAKINDINTQMENLQETVVKKQAALEKATARMEAAKLEVEEAEKAVKDYSPTHKEAGRKMMALLSSDPVALQQAMAAMLKQQAA